MYTYKKYTQVYNRLQAAIHKRSGGHFRTPKTPMGKFAGLMSKQQFDLSVRRLRQKVAMHIKLQGDPEAREICDRLFLKPEKCAKALELEPKPPKEKPKEAPEPPKEEPEPEEPQDVNPGD